MPRSRWSRASAVAHSTSSKTRDPCVARDGQGWLRGSRRGRNRSAPRVRAGQRFACRRVLAARPEHDPFDLTCAARLDQLATDRAQRCMRDRRRPRRAKTPEGAQRTDQAVDRAQNGGGTRSYRRRARAGTVASSTASAHEARTTMLPSWSCSRSRPALGRTASRFTCRSCSRQPRECMETVSTIRERELLIDGRGQALAVPG